MKYLLNLFFLFTLCFNLNAQKITKNNFLFENVKVNYLSCGVNKYNHFNIIIKNEMTDSVSFLKQFRDCVSKKNNSLNYILIIPKNKSAFKEKIALEFIFSILSRNKLFDKEMNLYSDDNYFNLYEETRKNEFNYKSEIYAYRKHIAIEKKQKIKDSLKLLLDLRIKNYQNKYTSLNKINKLVILKKDDVFCFQ